MPLPLSRPHRSVTWPRLAAGTLLMAAGLGLSAWTLPPALLRAPSLARPAGPDDTVAVHLYGVVLDGYSEAPLPFASLWLKQLAVGTQADEDGKFTLDLSPEQLRHFAVDTLQATARACRMRQLHLDFRRFPADSALTIVLRRDSAFVNQQPAVAAAARRHRTDALPIRPGAKASEQPPHRSFWQRLFGGK